MDTGFNYYYGADPSAYDLVVSNSEGGLERLTELGARRAEAVYWAADPDLFRPLDVEKEHDVFFYGYGDKFVASGCASSSASRRAVSRRTSRSAAKTSRATSDVRGLGVIPFNAFNHAIALSRISLNVTRRAHATVRSSSTARPFRLAMAGATIVSNPVEGSRRGSTRVASSSSSATRTRRPRPCRELLADRAQAEEIFAGARARALDEHTYAHRARRLLELIGLRGGRRWRDAARRGSARSRRAARASAARRDRPGAERGGLGRARHRRAARVRPGLEIVVVDDGSSTAPARSRPRAELACSVAVQPRHRRRRPDRVPVRVGAGFDVAVRVDGDGQHDPRSSTACSSRCSKARPTSPSARGSPLLRTAIAPRARAGSIRLLAWIVSALVRQRVTDTTSGFQAVNRLGIRLFAADYRTTIRRSRRRCFLQAPAPASGGPGVDARAPRSGRSSITAVHSVYYMVKVLLAIFVAIFRRNAVPLEEDTR